MRFPKENKLVRERVRAIEQLAERPDLTDESDTERVRP